MDIWISWAHWKLIWNDILGDHYKTKVLCNIAYNIECVIEISYRVRIIDHHHRSYMKWYQNANQHCTYVNFAIALKYHSEYESENGWRLIFWSFCLKYIQYIKKTIEKLSKFILQHLLGRYFFYCLYKEKSAGKFSCHFFYSAFQLNLSYQYLKRANFTNTLMIVCGGYQV